MTTPDTYNLTEAAQYLRVSRNTLRRFISAGLVPTFRAGTVTRIRRADLDQLFTAEAGGGTP